MRTRLPQPHRGDRELRGIAASLRTEREADQKEIFGRFLCSYKRLDFASVGIAIFGTPLISFAPAPPKQAWAPPPAPVRGWTGPQIGHANTVCRVALFTAISFSDVITRPNSTFTLTFDLRRKRLEAWCCHEADVPTPGHGQGVGPARYELSRGDDEVDCGRGRSEAKPNGVPPMAIPCGRNTKKEGDYQSFDF